MASLWGLTFRLEALWKRGCFTAFVENYVPKVARSVCPVLAQCVPSARAVQGLPLKHSRLLTVQAILDKQAVLEPNDRELCKKKAAPRLTTCAGGWGN